mgnify:CR=1 FL=1
MYDSHVAFIIYAAGLCTPAATRLVLGNPGCWVLGFDIEVLVCLGLGNVEARKNKECG